MQHKPIAPGLILALCYLPQPFQGNGWEGRASTRHTDALSPSPNLLVFLVHFVTLNLISLSCISTLNSFLALALADTVNKSVGSISDMFSDFVHILPSLASLLLALIANTGQVPSWFPCPQALPHQSFCHPACMVIFLKYKSDYITPCLETITDSLSFQRD